MPFLFLPSILGPMNSDLEKQHHMLDTDLEHMQSSGEPDPRPEKYCHLPSTLSVQKAMPPFYQASSFSMLAKK